jgi:hypothetical protein
MSEEQLDRREMLMQAMEAAEEGNLEVPEDKPLEVEASDDIAEQARNEKGQFAKEEEEAPHMEADSHEEEADEQVQEEEKPALQRPTTWKKEYLPIWDKLTAGEQLTKEEGIKLAEYAGVQRETEFKRGVSTYKAEADRAKPLIEVIAPIEKNLTSRGINPVQYVQNLVRAEQILSNAPYQQKVQIFQQLAADYGIQLNNEGQAQQLDPYTQQLMNQLNQVNQEVSSIKGRFAQEENQRLMGEIESFRSDVSNYPHFDVVREEMAQLLELGKAQDLKTAYKKAVRMNDDVWALEQDRLLKDAKQSAVKAQQVQKAKAAAVSPRSVTPSGKVSDGADKKDRRALLSEQLGEAMSRRV